MLMTEWNTEVAIRVSREEGLEEGIQKGREEEKRKMAEKLLKLHIPLDMVLEATGLSLAEIQSLQLQRS
jgi:predicted transposase/invertase (TIGR01784 family)